jgi:hypothetical protein
MAKKMRSIIAVFGPDLRISGGVTERIRESTQKKPYGIAMTRGWRTVRVFGGRIPGESQRRCGHRLRDRDEREQSE